MSFNLQDFMSNNVDFARGYTFYVKINGGFVDLTKTMYLVRSSSLPASTLDTAEANWQGNLYTVGATQNFGDFSCTFLVDPTDQIRHKFVKWMKDIHNPETNFHGVPNNYMQDITLQHVDQYSGASIMQYNLIGAFPQSVAEMTLDYANKGLAEFAVTFKYQYHTTE